MHDVSIFLFTISGLIFAGIVSELFFIKTHIPDALWMVLLGVIIGPILHLVDRNFLLQITPYIAAFCLIIILFDGGQHLQIASLKSTVGRTLILSICSFLFSTTLVALVSWLGALFGVFTDWSWIKAFLLGAILGNTSPAIIIPTMKLAKINARVTNMVSVESSLSDAISIVVATILISMAISEQNSSAIELSFSGIFLKSIFIGVGSGLALGSIGLMILPYLKGVYAYPITLSVLLAFYALVEEAGGSAPIAILLAATILGNARLLGKVFKLEGKRSLSEDVDIFHDQLAFVVKVFFFTFIGLMLELNAVSLLLGFIITALCIISRFPSAGLALKGSDDYSLFDRKMVTASVPRGLAAGVLATMPFHSGISGTQNLASIVFSVIIFSVLFFSIRFAMLKRNQPIEEGEETTTNPVG